MLKEDFVIQSQVRRILVRTNVDYSKISFGTVRGVVYFRGFFCVPGCIWGPLRRGEKLESGAKGIPESSRDRPRGCICACSTGADSEACPSENVLGSILRPG